MKYTMESLFECIEKFYDFKGHLVSIKISSWRRIRCVFFSLNGNGRNGKVTANKDNYSITFDDGSRPMVAKLSDGGNTLTLSIEDLNMHFRFTKN